MDLGKAEGWSERLHDSPGAAGVDGVAVAVVGGDAFEQQIPLAGLALPRDAVLHGAGPPRPLDGKVPRGDEFDAGCGGAAGFRMPRTAGLSTVYVPACVPQRRAKHRSAVAVLPLLDREACMALRFRISPAERSVSPQQIN